jgi:hypothetical protein
MLKFLKTLPLASKYSVEKLSAATCDRTSSCHYSNKPSKKDEDRLKRRLNYYVENELPDKSLEIKLTSLKSEIKTQVMQQFRFERNNRIYIK